MKPFTQKFFIVTAGLMFNAAICTSQSNYEMLFLQGKFEQILAETTGFNSPDDYYWHGAVLNRLAKNIEAIGILEEGLDSFESDEQLELLIAELYFNTGRYTKAKPLLVKYQDSPGKFIQLIELLEFEKNHREAITLLKEKAITDSSNLQYLIHLGDNYYQLNNTESAVEYFEKAILINPNDQLTANKLASIYLKTKNFEGTLELCDMMLANDSTNKTFIKLKGMASFNIDDYKTAQQCFYTLLSAGDSGKFTLKHLGISELNNYKWHVSREHLLLAYAIDSNDFETCFFLGKAYLNSMEPKKGLLYFNRADSLLQPDPKVLSAIYIEKQSIYNTLKEYHKAIECYQTANRYHPRPENLFYIASIYANSLGDNNNALKYYELFINTLPPKPESDHRFDEGQITVSLRKAAEEQIALIKEEMFFNGELDNEK